MIRTLLSFLVLTSIAPLSITAQEPPMPDHPTLREGFLAWDRGDYPAALRAYLKALDEPDGDAWVSEVALLTVRWETADGWADTLTTDSASELPGLKPGGEVRVRARHERGTVGWDWAIASGAGP